MGVAVANLRGTHAIACLTRLLVDVARPSRGFRRKRVTSGQLRSSATSCRNLQETPGNAASIGHERLRCGTADLDVCGPPRSAAILLRLRSLLPQGSGGSSPLFRTTRLSRFAPSLVAGHSTESSALSERSESKGISPRSWQVTGYATEANGVMKADHYPHHAATAPSGRASACSRAARSRGCGCPR
jgi:hypothetical protein